MHTTNSVNPAKHISEAAAIFAAGIVRSRCRRDTSNEQFSEERLDFSFDSSVHSSNPSASGEKL